MSWQNYLAKLYLFMETRYGKIINLTILGNELLYFRIENQIKLLEELS